MEHAVLSRGRCFRLLLLILWCGVIFALSAMPGSGLPIEPPLWYILERKSAHVFEYAVLTILAYWYFRAVFSRETCIRLALLSAAFAIMYGALDELHQFFVFGRGARISDVLIDALGAGLGVTTVWLIFWRHRLWQRGVPRSCDEERK